MSKGQAATRTRAAIWIGGGIVGALLALLLFDGLWAGVLLTVSLIVGVLGAYLVSQNAL
jgi:hypothetical protein